MTTKVTPRHQIYICAACQDTGVNSKGHACVPCVVNKRIDSPSPKVSKNSNAEGRLFDDQSRH